MFRRILIYVTLVLPLFLGVAHSFFYTYESIDNPLTSDHQTELDLSLSVSRDESIVYPLPRELQRLDGTAVLFHRFSNSFSAGLSIPFYADRLDDGESDWAIGDLSIFTRFYITNFSNDGVTYSIRSAISLPTGSSSEGVLPRYPFDIYGETSFYSSEMMLFLLQWGYELDLRLRYKKPFLLQFYAGALLSKESPVALGELKLYHYISDVTRFSLALEGSAASETYGKNGSGSLPWFITPGFDYSFPSGVNLGASASFSLNSGSNLLYSNGRAYSFSPSPSISVSLKVPLRRSQSKRYDISYEDTLVVVDEIDFDPTKCPSLPPYYKLLGWSMDGLTECPDLALDSDGDGVPDAFDKCPYEYGEFRGFPWDGCPQDSHWIESASTPDLNDGAAHVLSGVVFASGSTSLDGSAKVHLHSLVEKLREYPDRCVVIKGFTDSTGDYDLNVRISRQRADSVRDYLIERGIDSSRIEIRAYGPNRPIRENSTVDGRAANRRIEAMMVNCF